MLIAAQAFLQRAAMPRVKLRGDAISAMYRPGILTDLAIWPKTEKTDANNYIASRMDLQAWIALTQCRDYMNDTGKRYDAHSLPALPAH